MKKSEKLSRKLLAAAAGIVLALGVGTATRVLADSGGVYCGYGDCTLLYDNCDWVDYVDEGSGECQVTTSQNNGCTVTYWCDGTDFDWFAYSTSSTWRVKDLLLAD